MKPEQSLIPEESAVNAVIDAMAKAVRAGDVDAMLAQCAPGIVIFDMVPPIKHEGEDSIRALWSKTLEPFQPPLEFEFKEVDITIGGNVAFARCFSRFGGTRSDGTRVANWMRSTLGFQKVDGRWRIVHQHVSVPFDMQTGKAMLELEP